MTENTGKWKETFGKIGKNFNKLKFRKNFKICQKNNKENRVKRKHENIRKIVGRMAENTGK